MTNVSPDAGAVVIVNVPVAPGAGRFRDMVSAGVKDPAGRLLRDAVNDEVLFRELLEAPLDEVGELSVEATRRLNVWAFNVLAEYGGAFEEE